MQNILHIIHLSRRKDRKASVLQQLFEQEILDFQFWEGIEEGLPIRDIARAHKSVVRWARESGLPSVLIAEDDLQFTAPGAFRYYQERVPTDYDLYLGSINYGKIQPDQSVEDFSGTTLYTIHSRFFDTFLSTREDSNIDRALAGKGKYKVCDPLVAYQVNGYSDNSQRFIDYGPYKKRFKYL
jgi:hypothetical protein